MGVRYLLGEGVAKDTIEGVNWYRKAAEQGKPTAQYNLGLCYSRGYGVSKDITKSVKWFRKAAEQGNAEGQYNLGVCYEKGDGVAQDDVTAHMWSNLAAASGSKIAKSAKELLSRLETKMTSGEIAEARLLSRDWEPRQYQRE